MEQELTGMVYEIRGFSQGEGPGIRTAVVMKGCTLHCPWCGAPDKQSLMPRLSFDMKSCGGLDGCGERCIRACPRQALVPGDIGINSRTGETARYVFIRRWSCNNCGACVHRCYARALQLRGSFRTVEQVMERLLADRRFFEGGRGGVTLTGGEPLAQPLFTLALLERLKQEGIHTALHTTGHVSPTALEATLPLTDLYLLELRHMDPGIHRRALGVDNTQVLATARRIAQAGGRLQLRIPVLSRFNDDSETIWAMARFILELGPDAVTAVELEPRAVPPALWHPSVGLDVSPPSAERMQALRSIMESEGLSVSIEETI